MKLEQVEQLLWREFPGILKSQGLDLEGLTVRSVGQRTLVRVLVDKDDGVSLDDVAAISRLLSVELDSGNPLGERPFTLEVSSPGIERPLTLARHWRRNVGRNVRVRFRDGSKPLTGRVVRVGESSVMLDVSGIRTEVDLDAVDKAVVQVELKSKKSEREVPTKGSA